VFKKLTGLTATRHKKCAEEYEAILKAENL
jgi:hypothetical protein